MAEETDMTITVPDPAREETEIRASNRDQTPELRHATKLAALMHGRADLRGVHAYADLVEEALLWSA